MRDPVNEQVQDTGLVCVHIIARFFGLPADMAQLKLQFSQTNQLFKKQEILLSLKHLGLKAREINSNYAKLENTTLPAIVQNKEGKYFILAKYSKDEVLVQVPQESRPLKLPRQVFEESWNGKLILVTKRVSLTDQLREFDIKWFIPAIIKYRKLLGEVLLASFFIQLFALGDLPRNDHNGIFFYNTTVTLGATISNANINNWIIHGLTLRIKCTIKS